MSGAEQDWQVDLEERGGVTVDAAPPTEPEASSVAGLPGLLGWLGATATVAPRASASTAPAPGLPSGARYTEVRELARGGMGSVLLVRDHHLGRTVAMKRLIGPRPDASAVRRFLQEAQITGQLEHPNVMTVHEVGLDGEGGPYYTMPWIRGGESLEKVIHKLRLGDPDYRRRYGLHRRVELMLAVARALAFAHARGVVHRDVKPANVMVGRFGEVLLLDWGLARVAGQGAPEAVVAGEELRIPDPALTDAEHVLGTPLYMAPEQARGETDPRSDVYAFAAVLYELLSLEHYLGQPAATPVEVLRQVASARPVPADAHQRPGQPRVPHILASICARGLEKEPTRRFQSMDEVVRVLERWLDATPDVCCPTTLCVRGLGAWRRLVESRPALAGLATLVLPPLALLGAWTVVREVAGLLS